MSDNTEKCATKAENFVQGEKVVSLQQSSAMGSLVFSAKAGKDDDFFDQPSDRERSTAASLHLSLMECTKPVFAKVLREDVFNNSNPTERKKAPNKLKRELRRVIAEAVPVRRVVGIPTVFAYSSVLNVYVELDAKEAVNVLRAQYLSILHALQSEFNDEWEPMNSRGLDACINEALEPDAVEEVLYREDLFYFRNNVWRLSEPLFYDEDLKFLESEAVEVFPPFQRTFSGENPGQQVFNTRVLRANLIRQMERPQIWDNFCNAIGYDTEELKLALENLLLYIISPSMARHEGYFLVGSGRNGKSVLLNFLECIVGREFVSNVSLESINEAFGLEPLIGKFLNSSSESGAGDFIHSARFKALTAGDAQTVNRKNLKAIPSLKLPAKNVCALNAMPTVSDTSDGMWERMRILLFSKQIPESQRKDNYHNYLLAQRDEIISWWVWSHLTQFGRFNPKFPLPDIFKTWSDRVFLNEWNPVEDFIHNHLQPNSAASTTASEVWLEFVRFQERQSLQLKLNPTSFGRKLKELFKRIRGVEFPERKLETVNGTKESVYKGIQLEKSCGAVQQ